LIPKAVRVPLPTATISNEQELEAWVGEVRAAVKGQLKRGPVIL
jgi:superfamily II RNA helicase